MFHNKAYKEFHKQKIWTYQPTFLARASRKYDQNEYCFSLLG